MKRSARLCVLIPICSLAACSREKGDRPHAVADPKQLGLISVSASDIHGDSAILGPAASGEELAKPAAAAGQAAVTIDLSSAEAAAKSYIDVINAGQIAQLAQIVAPDQQQPVTDLAAVLAPLAESAAHLQKALADKFSGHAFVFAMQNDFVPADWLRHWTVAGVEADAADPNTATAKLQVENGQDTATRTLKKAEDKWHVQEANLPAADAAKNAESTITQLADALKALAGRVESGDIADADAAEKEIKTTIENPSAAPAATPTAAAQPGATPAKADAKKATAAADKKPSKPGERPKSELENDMDGAAQRSVLGGGP